VLHELVDVDKAGAAYLAARLMYLSGQHEFFLNNISLFDGQSCLLGCTAV
jgi:hypothetical protein